MTRRILWAVATAAGLTVPAVAASGGGLLAGHDLLELLAIGVPAAAASVYLFERVRRFRRTASAADLARSAEPPSVPMGEMPAEGSVSKNSIVEHAMGAPAPFSRAVFDWFSERMRIATARATAAAARTQVTG